MIYLTPYSRPGSPELWGQITSPNHWGKPAAGYRWAMDNGCFTGKFSGDEFWKRLDKLRSMRAHCLFVVAPDVISDSIQTLNAWRYWGPAIHNAGWPAAFVAQDGQENLALPPEFDALFIGGSTEWKMGPHALRLIAVAKSRGAWVHVGRVNSLKRMAHFQLAGVDSVDGTGPVFGPDKYRHLYERQLRKRPLFEISL